jgi:hypothetical protein
MAFTRFKYDECRTVKGLQQATDPGKWILDVPGNGPTPCYIEDPQIRIQRWGANLRTNTINLESDLLGVNRKVGRDCLENTYQSYNVKNEAMKFPTCDEQFTKQSRAIAPAWMIRDKEQVDWYYPPINPQENTCYPFENNISTRILEKDYFIPQNTCNFENSQNKLPVSFTNQRGNYIGGPNLCTIDNSCRKVNNI